MNDNSGNYKKVVLHMPEHFHDLVSDVCEKRGLTFGKVFTQLIDRALIEMPDPFGYDMTLPVESEYLENTFYSEGGKLINYLKNFPSGLPLRSLIMNRHSFGVPDKAVLLIVFADCLHQGILMEHEVPVRYYYGKPIRRPEGEPNYRLREFYEEDKKRMGKKRKRMTNKEVSQYDTYLKLKRRFEKEA